MLVWYHTYLVKCYAVCETGCKSMRKRSEAGLKGNEERDAVIQAIVDSPGNPLKRGGMEK